MPPKMPPIPGRLAIPVPDYRRGAPVPGVVPQNVVQVMERSPADRRGAIDWTGNNGGLRASMENNGTGEEKTCQLNGGVHSCSYWIVPKGGVYPADLQPCRVRTALVGIDMDFYRCADPTSPASVEIDRAYAARRIHPQDMRGRRYFCYHHMGKLFGLIPRPARPPGKGYRLRAVSNFPAFATIATFAQDPLGSGNPRANWPNPRYPGDPTASAYVNTVPNLSVLNRYNGELPVVGAPPGSAISLGLPGVAVAAGADYRENILQYDNFCYRDLGDYAVDGRQNADDPLAQMTQYPEQCVPLLANYAAPPADDFPLPPGAEPGPLPAAFRGAAVAPRNAAQTASRNASTKGPRNPWCWEAQPGDAVNCAVRRVRFRYFPPRVAEPVRGNGYPRPTDMQGLPMERNAIYTVVPIQATARPGGHVDIKIDLGALMIARTYCPVPGNPLQTCVNVKPLRRFVAAIGE